MREEAGLLLRVQVPGGVGQRAVAQRVGLEAGASLLRVWPGTPAGLRGSPWAKKAQQRLVYKELSRSRADCVFPTPVVQGPCDLCFSALAWQRCEELGAGGARQREERLPGALASAHGASLGEEALLRPAHCASRAAKRKAPDPAETRAQSEWMVRPEWT